MLAVGATFLLAGSSVVDDDLHVGTHGAEERTVGAEAGAIGELCVFAHRLDELEWRALIQVHLRKQRSRSWWRTRVSRCSTRWGSGGVSMLHTRPAVGTCMSSEALTTR
jgi:hypothetical protein